MSAPRCRYSCATAAETLEWMIAITDFLRPYKHLMDAHVVNFFKDRLWETLDQEWMECLRQESTENLLGIPSGLIQDHWPSSLREFILTMRPLVLQREPNLSHSIIGDLDVSSLNSALAQGMNLKKKHEVEILAAVIKRVASVTGSETVIDVGAGQGYLAQALSFQYELSVTALDASLHHATVTSARAERIKKHYASKLRKSQNGNLLSKSFFVLSFTFRFYYLYQFLSAGNQQLKMPETVTCCVLSSNTLTALSTATSDKSVGEKSSKIGNDLDIAILENIEVSKGKTSPSSNNHSIGSSLVLTGLHACGNLSVDMLRTFVECERVRAVVSIGCCYNLLSEECLEKTSVTCGFPMCNSANLSGFILGKNARDLACQSAERWKSLTEGAAHQNFELHVYRAAFQMVLDKFFPEVINSSPSIGRQGKALRRQQNRRVREEGTGEGTNNYKEETHQFTVHSHSPFSSDMSHKEAQCLENSDKYLRFEEFSKSGLHRLGLGHSQAIDFLAIWKDAQPFSEFVGPYWSIRAALGPLVETYILLDRLLFLQEQGGSVEAFLLPLFDPILSPRNVAIIARKSI